MASSPGSISDCEEFEYKMNNRILTMNQCIQWIKQKKMSETSTTSTTTSTTTTSTTSLKPTYGPGSKCSPNGYTKLY